MLLRGGAQALRETAAQRLPRAMMRARHAFDAATRVDERCCRFADMRVARSAFALARCR